MIIIKHIQQKNSIEIIIDETNKSIIVLMPYLFYLIFFL